MTRKNRNRNAGPSAHAAQPARVARPADPAASARHSLQMALDAEPIDTRPPSLRAAERYRVEESRYSNHEVTRAAVAKQDARDAMAMDFAGAGRNSLTFVENTAFPGFPVLALLAQLPEYRSMHETLADECIRMWGKVTSTGAADEDTCKQIEAELKRIDLRATVRQLVIHDQAFGGGHAFLKFKGDQDVRNLPLVLKPYSVKRGTFEGVRVVEPYWVTPNDYNSIDPTAADFYKPSSWWMLSVLTHATRLQTIVSRPVADMLKPAYSFRGISMSQLSAPYVDNWLRTRQSVSDTVKQFSISGVRTDLQQALQPGGGQSLAMRAELINRLRDNRNIMFLDLATEEFFQVNTPLSGLDALQAQSQEQMSAVSHIPLVKLLGLTPTGLNASSEGEIRVFYDYVRGYQSNVLMSFMMTVLRVVQLSLFGKIDDDVSWEWLPLQELTDLEAAELRAKDAEADERYVNIGAVVPEQVAAALAADPSSRYTSVADMALEDIPDDDVGAITDKILEIQPETAEPVDTGSELPPDAGNPPPGMPPVQESAPGEGTENAHAAALQPAPATVTESDPQALALRTAAV